LLTLKIKPIGRQLLGRPVTCGPRAGGRQQMTLKYLNLLVFHS
jgi:hypothetical protein